MRWALGFLLFCSTLSPQAAISNGGFESPGAGAFYRAFLAGENIGGWVVESGSVEIVGTYWQSAEGSQSLDLSGIWEWAGTIYQDIATIPGQKYTIRFAFAGNPEDQAIKDAKVFWNDAELATLTVDTAGRSLSSMGWVYYTYEVTATAATSRLKFQSLTLNFLGPVIDDVSVSAVAPQAPLSNGSFEEPIISVPWQPFFTGANLGGWIVESGSVEIVGDHWQTADGIQLLDTSGIDQMPGSIYQDLVTTPGQKYTLKFAFAGNPADEAIKEAKVFWNDHELAKLTVDTTGRSFTNMGWTYYSYEVTATAATSRLKFQSLTDGALGPVIDNVSLTPSTAAALTIDTVVRIKVSGSPGAKYRIDYSSHLHNAEWYPLETVTIPPGGEILVFDTDGVHGRQRNYRAIQVTE